MGGEALESRYCKVKSSSQCDLIMKGGVTSGVVYPAAVLELAKTYRFRSIGGASAGAIAAAVTAAAEYARESGGFERLDELRKELRTKGFLKSLFQPQKDAEGLFEFLLAVSQELGPRRGASEKASGLSAHSATGPGASAQKHGLGARALYRHARAHFGARGEGAGKGMLFGLVVAAALQVPWFLLVASAPRGVPLLTSAGVAVALFAAFAFAGAKAGQAWSIAQALLAQLRFVSNKSESGFGLCRGSQGTDPCGGADALTDWLSRRIDGVAGLDGRRGPLTFRHLHDKDAGEDGSHLSIEFQLIAVNLSQQQPYLFPLEKETFAFAKADMDRLFPPYVVRYLCEWGRRHPFQKVRLPDGYFKLPKGKDLPVIVATRLSLSFPGLLSAVRLYSIKPRCFKRGSKTKPYVAQVEDLEENWFSDGGIASNFPIHMFDAWFPARPTFGINLSDQAFDSENRVGLSLLEDLDEPQGAGQENGEDGSVSGDVFLPHPRDELRMRARVKPIVSIADFAAAVFGTAQNFRDTVQATLPSYRERIVHIALKAGEGGLNLDMDPEVIEAIERKGAQAGQRFQDFDFAQHQWVRSLVLLDKLEREARKLTEDKTPLRLRAAYRWLLAQQKKQLNGDKWYRPKDALWCQSAIRRLGILIRCLEVWSGRTNPVFARNPPRPESILRVTPPV